MTTVLTLSNLLDYSVRVFLTAKRDRDMKFASSMVIKSKDCEVFKVKPGLDLDQEQTLMCVTEELDLKKIHNSIYNIFEIGRAEDVLIWRTSPGKLNYEFEPTGFSRDLTIQSTSLCNTGNKEFFSACLIPTQNEPCAEIEFEDVDTDSEFSNPA